jgi:outer membrane lipoprotein-sorting protein
LGKVTTISDGKITWLISPMTGKQQVPDKDDPSSANCWGLKFENAKVTGSEAVNGHECWIVESSKKDSMTDRYWLDKAKYDVLKGESRDQDGHVLLWVLSDFQPLSGGFEYPYKMDVFSGDTVVASMSVKNITVNTGIADSLFDPDKVDAQKTDVQEMLRRLLEQQGADSAAPDTTEPPKK